VNLADLRKYLFITYILVACQSPYGKSQIVFTATYLAMAMVPVLSGLAGFGSPVTVVIRRGDGYYGNSRIFRGGENLADPHLAGDEHSEFLAHAAHPARRAGAAGSAGADSEDGESAHEHERHYAGARGQGKQRTLRTSTLAEEATLQELKAARAKAKADALLRAQRIAMEDDDDDDSAALDLVEEESNPVIVKAKEAALKKVKKPIMPLKKLAAKVRGASNEKESQIVSHGEVTPAEAREPAEFVHGSDSDSDSTTDTKEGETAAAAAAAGAADTEEELQASGEDDEAELEGIIAKLRKEALDRRLNKIHKAQRDVAKSASKNTGANADDEAKIRRPGIVKSRKVSTKEE